MDAQRNGAQVQVPSQQWCATFADLLATSPINLVSRNDRRNVRRLHIEECLAVARSLSITDGARWIDLGTGGGLPGIVLAAAFPTTSWTLLDARAKKLAEVRHFASVLALSNIETLHGRAETLADAPAHRGRYAGVIARAVSSLHVTVALARGFVDDGDIVAIRGPRASEEASALAQVGYALGITVETVQRIDATMRPTWLVRVRAVGSPPDHFPRVRTELLRSARGGAR